MIQKLYKMKILKKNDLLKLLLSCIFMLIAIFVYVIISGNKLEIVVNNIYLNKICHFIDNNIILTSIVRLSMYYLQWIFVIHAIYQEKIFKNKFLENTIIIVCFWVIKTCFIELPFYNYLDFIFFALIAFKCKKKWYRAIIGCVLVFLFMFVSSFIKGIFMPNTDFNNLPSLIVLCFSIDIYLMCYIYYLNEIYRKENNYGKLAYIFQIFKKVENYFCCVSKSSCCSDSNNSCVNSNLKEKLYNKYCFFIFFVITYLSLLIVGIIFNRWIEITLSIIFFHIFRGNEKETFHGSNDIQCWIVSMINFGVITSLTLPLYISYIVSIALSFILCIIMRLIYKMVKLSNLNKREKIIELLGNDNLEEENIEKICTKIGLTSKYSETIYLYLNNTIEETASILEVDNKTISRRINKFIEVITKCSIF